MNKEFLKFKSRMQQSSTVISLREEINRIRYHNLGFKREDHRAARPASINYQVEELRHISHSKVPSFSKL